MSDRSPRLDRFRHLVNRHRARFVLDVRLGSSSRIAFTLVLHIMPSSTKTSYTDWKVASHPSTMTTTRPWPTRTSSQTTTRRRLARTTIWRSTNKTTSLQSTPTDPSIKRISNLYLDINTLTPNPVERDKVQRLRQHQHQPRGASRRPHRLQHHPGRGSTSGRRQTSSN